MPDIEIGYVEHWFSKIMVAGIKLTGGALKVGEKIRIKGHTTDFTMTISSIQVDNNALTEAPKGTDIGIKTPDHARLHDKVYKIVD